MAYFLIPIAYPACDEQAKNAAIGRYEKRLQELGMPDMNVDPNSTYNWSAAVDASIVLERELEACNCELVASPMEMYVRRFREWKNTIMN